MKPLSVCAAGKCLAPFLAGWPMASSHSPKAFAFTVSHLAAIVFVLPLKARAAPTPAPRNQVRVPRDACLPASVSNWCVRWRCANNRDRRLFEAAVFVLT